MSHACIVIEVESAEYLQAVTTIIGNALRAAYDRDPSDDKVQVTGRTWTATDDVYEMIVGVFVEPKPGAGKHTAVVRADGKWVLEHSLACRRAGLLNCPITDLMSAAIGAGHVPTGTFPVSLDESGTLLWGDDL